ncbi:endoplasmic reticulum metallopeptidase 1 [Pelomyxa schiedti]|nr:endoplasmic reticulum metallopeptidase 1 [Pelomyxa schiedti]
MSYNKVPTSESASSKAVAFLLYDFIDTSDDDYNPLDDGNQATSLSPSPSSVSASLPAAGGGDVVAHSPASVSASVTASASRGPSAGASSLEADWLVKPIAGWPLAPKDAPRPPPPRPRLKRDCAVSAAMWWAIVVVTVVVCWFSAEWGCVRRLPPAEGLDADLGLFSEARARQYLQQLADIGDNRFAGTLELNETVGTLLSILSSMKVTKGNAGVNMDIDYRETFGGNSSSSINSIWETYPLISVRVYTTGYEARAILLDSHIDSAIQGPGISDNLVGVSTALEVLRAIVDTDGLSLRNAFIIVFGLQEEGMFEAQSFMNDSPWKSTVVGFINQDSLGSASQGAMLAQSSQYSVAQAYAKAPYPLGFSFISDLFRVGAFYPKTSFQVYNSYGLPGIDLLHMMSGQTYHTSLDTLERVSSGVLQHDGDNLLFTVLHLLTNNFKEDKSEIFSISGPGTFLLASTKAAWGTGGALLGCVLICLVVCLAVFSKKHDHFAHMVGMHTVIISLSVIFGFITLMAGVGFPALFGLLLWGINEFTYVSNYSVLVAMSACASFAGILLTHSLFSYTMWRFRKTFIVRNFYGRDLQWDAIAGLSILYSAMFIIFLACGWRFSIIFLYPAVAAPCAIGFHFLAKHIVSIMQRDSKIYGRMATIDECTPLCILLCFSNLGNQVSMQLILAWTHGGKNIITPNWPLWPLFKQHKFCADRDQGSRSLGLYWIVAVIGVVTVILFIVASAMKGYSSNSPLRYVPNYVFDSQSNSAYISISPNDCCLGDLKDALQKKGFNFAECNTFLSNSKSLCMPTTTPISAAPPTLQVTQNLYNISTSLRYVQFEIVGLPYPRYQIAFNCTDAELGVTNIAINQIALAGAVTDATAVVKYTGNQLLTTNSISFTTTQQGQCTVKLTAQNMDTSDTGQLSQVMQSMPSWTVPHSMPEHFLPSVTITSLLIPAV